MRAVLWKPPLHLATAGFCERCSSKDVVALVCVYDLSVPPASGPGLWATMDGLSPWKWSVSPYLRGTRLLFPNW